jgi:hypothetical protein
MAVTVEECHWSPSARAKFFDIDFNHQSPIYRKTMGAFTFASRRGLLASLWSFVSLLTAISFIVALFFILSAENYEDNDDDWDGSGDQNEDTPAEMAVASRAMVFAALWTSVLATLIAIFGTVVLGWQAPTGQYYTCCSPQVHRTTPLALGSFIGSLLMFANITLVCAVLFGEFEIRDYQNNEGEGEKDQSDTAVRRSARAISIMCTVLTLLYSGFAALTFSFSKAVLEEEALDANETEMQSTRSSAHYGYDGYFGERFDIRPSSNGFVAPQPTGTTLI